MIRPRAWITGLIALGLAPTTSGTAWAAHPYVYPAKGQSQEQMQKDMYECHQWATKQTGFDPSRPVEESIPHQSVLGSGARGALLGTAIGAIAGDTGKGAAIGATAGALSSAMRNRQAVNQQQQTYNSSTQMYDRAYATCLKGRGYTVG